MSGCCADKACTDQTCMKLPEGKTCADCAHLRRCEMLFGEDGKSNECDFFPRRFRLPVAPAGRETEGR